MKTINVLFKTSKIDTNVKMLGVKRYMFKVSKKKASKKVEIEPEETISSDSSNEEHEVNEKKKQEEVKLVDVIVPDFFNDIIKPKEVKPEPVLKFERYEAFSWHSDEEEQVKGKSLFASPAEEDIFNLSPLEDDFNNIY